MIVLNKTKLKNYFKLSLKTQNIRSNNILINYLNTYPLWSSNLLNFNDFVDVFEVYKNLK